MARAISTSDIPLLTNDQSPPEPAEGPPGGGAEPLLRAVALQRPVSELVQLVTLLNEGDQPAHAQQLLDTAATLRSVEDVAALLPLLGGSQATTALRAAAAQRPVEELAQLVGHLHGPPEAAAEFTAEQAEQQVRWKLHR
ncbi:hypothetical protein [Streptacidiphilus sp. PAMC 29251]